MDHLNSLINDAIDELHRKHYLDLDSPIYATIHDAVEEDSLDLKVKNPGVFQRLSRDAQTALSELSSMIGTIVYHVTQIKPPTGLLSATREGVLWEMTQVGALLPQDYLWQVEKVWKWIDVTCAIVEFVRQWTISFPIKVLTLYLLEGNLLMIWLTTSVLLLKVLHKLWVVLYIILRDETMGRGRLQEVKNSGKLLKLTSEKAVIVTYESCSYMEVLSLRRVAWRACL